MGNVTGKFLTTLLRRRVGYGAMIHLLQYRHASDTSIDRDGAGINAVRTDRNRAVPEPVPEPVLIHNIVAQFGGCLAFGPCQLISYMIVQMRFR